MIMPSVNPCTPNSYCVQRQLQPNLKEGGSLRETKLLKAFTQVSGQGKDT